MLQASPSSGITSKQLVKKSYLLTASLGATRGGVKPTALNLVSMAESIVMRQERAAWLRQISWPAEEAGAAESALGELRPGRHC